MSWTTPRTARIIQQLAWQQTKQRPSQYICQRCSRRFSSSPPNNRASEVAQPAAQISSQDEISRARRYCLDMLRKYDTPSSLLLPYIPSHARDAYVALRAFNIEIARTADTTSTPTIGSMRLQFHREAVTKALAGTPPKQPIAILLAYASDLLSQRTHGGVKWSKPWFDRLISTREKHLSNPPYVSLAALETYAENTYSTLFYLTLQALPMASLTADHIASHIGKAAGVTAVLRGLPLLAFPGPPNSHSNQSGQQLPGGIGGDVGASRHGAVPLPLDIMAEVGLREEDVLRRGGEAEGLRDAVFAVATRANDHLITARSMLKNVREGKDVGHEFEHGDEVEHFHWEGGNSISAESFGEQKKPETQAQEVERAFGVFMPAVATQAWLDRLQQRDFDVFDPKLRVTDWRLPWKAFWAYRRREL